MEQTFIDLALTFSLIFGAVWFTILTSRLNRSLESVENGDIRLEEIRESIEIVGQILNRLPELMPQFNMPQTNPFAALVENLVENITGAKVSKAEPAPRSDEGRFIDGSTTWEEEGASTPSQADAEDPPGP